MLKIYKSGNEDEIFEVRNFEKGTWINLVNPSEEEINIVSAHTGIYNEFIRYPLDEEERPHIEFEDNQLLILINVPVIRHRDVIYETIPLGIIVTDDHIVTACLEEVEIIKDFYSRRIKGFATNKRTRFVFQILFKNSAMYLKYLREIDKKTDEIELELHKSMKNRELIKLLNLEKSLVYFTTSLRSNEIVMEKLLRGKLIKMYEEDQDLLEDVIIENKQAIEMANIYSNILSGMMDAFASIISNNLNIVMKFLAAVTIVLALPTMVASFFGMNVDLPFQQSPYGFAIIVAFSVVLSGTAIVYLVKRDMF
ncbi:MAG: magnesium transporter CorA family protein [Peptococcaceae bacterium]|jgi:magnesium transporter|nr:magnesium transporter CorA family protein [Peptococcaceae bacterium]MDH7524917.1 magnesium transporter CorA family protein [Peptococcaceae bacterium]